MISNAITFIGLTPAKYKEKTDTLSSEGYVIICVQGYITGEGEDINTYDMVAVQLI